MLVNPNMFISNGVFCPPKAYILTLAMLWLARPNELMEVLMSVMLISKPRRYLA